MPKCGRKCEIYSRVVGYHRPVKNWNRGKREEFRQRKEMTHQTDEEAK
jgi:ribonucleoside-triphosphate reductase